MAAQYDQVPLESTSVPGDDVLVYEAPRLNRGKLAAVAFGLVGLCALGLSSHLKTSNSLRVSAGGPLDATVLDVTLSVPVAANVKPGEKLKFSAPDGKVYETTVPAGFTGGSVQVTVPSAPDLKEAAQQLTNQGHGVIDSLQGKMNDLRSQMSSLDVTVPSNWQPGQQLSVKAPTGQSFNVPVPEGLKPGDDFKFTVADANDALQNQLAGAKQQMKDASDKWTDAFSGLTGGLANDMEKAFGNDFSALKESAAFFDDCLKAHATQAGKYTCSQRLFYLVDKKQQTMEKAANAVASEYPKQCGYCGNVASMSTDEVSEMLTNSLPASAKEFGNDFNTLKDRLPAADQAKLDSIPSSDMDARLRELAKLTMKREADAFQGPVNFDKLKDEFADSFKSTFDSVFHANKDGFATMAKAGNCGKNSCAAGSVCCKNAICCGHDSQCLETKKNGYALCWSGQAKIPAGLKASTDVTGV